MKSFLGIMSARSSPLGTLSLSQAVHQEEQWDGLSTSRVILFISLNTRRKAMSQPPAII